ncbi:MAG: glutamate--tRNA ligase, partial [Deltaproteobacteria bacterium]
ESVGRSSGVFNPEKLLWLNHHYIKESSPEGLSKLLVPFLEERGVMAGKDARLPAIVKTLKERSNTLKEMAENALFYFRDKVEYDPKAVRKFLSRDNMETFKTLIERLEGLKGFTEGELEAVFNSMLDEKGLKLGKVAQPVRVALTGGAVSPGIYEMISAMGKELALKRLREAITYMEKGAGV